MARELSQHDLYCTVCGSPLSSMWLRRDLTIQPGDDEDRTCDDECDCEFENSPEYEDYGYDSDYPDFGGDHAVGCKRTFGYDGTMVTGRDIAWLDKVVMLDLRDRRSYHSGVFQMEPGTLDGVFRDKSGALTFVPLRRKVFLHATCCSMLHPIHRTSSEQPLDIHRLGRVMRARMHGENVDWGDDDPRLFGGAEEHHGAEGWEAKHGTEHFVADPMKAPDFRGLVTYIVELSTSMSISESEANLGGDLAMGVDIDEDGDDDKDDEKPGGGERRGRHSGSALSNN
ncbi:hypothetical protein BDW74DRAFT_175045 [Aspergillus multicolor]|uniref:uncharacterized protein n=1 Tax=Aspergillus multicolor TaxID=41759 RepID=UPI003CCCD06A